MMRKSVEAVASVLTALLLFASPLVAQDAKSPEKAYMLEHSGIDTDRLTIKDYPGGHMMYLYRPSADAVSDDIVAFINGGGRAGAK